jgi:hypothetical protein
MSTDNFKWWHSIQGFSEELDTRMTPEEDGSKYIINSHGFRCDEFTNIHEKKHILFSGCSNTYGVGLKKEEIWPYKVYEKINKEEGCSGYFNIGLGGNNIINSILNIFKYCKKFGNPDIIFINFPCHSRFFDFDKDELVYRVKSYSDFYANYYINKLTIYNYYFILEQYCKNNNIKLFSFTWSLHDQYYMNKKKKIFIESTNDSFKKYNFKTFYYIDQNNLNDGLFLLKQKYDNPFFDIARDGNRHRGNGIHMYWTDFIYNKYLENKQ